MTAPDRYRLPRAVMPSRYDLVLRPDLTTLTFSGTVRISAEVTAPTDAVVLNAIELDIDSASITTGNEAVSVTVSLDEETERATLTPPQPLGAGPCSIEIDFRGTLNDKLAGFYRSTFRDESGQERIIATTQFESTDARRAFPCFDEPDFKASFAVALEVDSDLTAISNGPLESEEPIGDGRKRVRFGETMRMSTYLVAFVVGPLEVTEPTDVDGVPLRVAHVPGKANMTSWALEAGAHSVRHFTDYFGLPYPADKLDLIALPDFAFGAMENLGAVTFRETALLVDPDTASRLDHERVADVVAHEIAHMWFGDLVTMRWWNGIWLNEAFATFMELVAVDAFRPEWQRWVSFGTSRASALLVDGMTATRPVEFPVGAPEEAEGMFDVLTYQKGASVVRMLEQYLGAERFRSGIRTYMQRHAYGNTETTDLWDAIEEASAEPVRSMMDTWIFQGGYPLVSVELSEDRREVTMRQQRFLYTGATDATRWKVPVLFRTSAGGAVVEGRTVIDEQQAVSKFDEAVDWIVVNAGGSGFFRTNYSPDLLTRLLTDNGPELSAIERFNLVSDTWAAVLSGKSKIEQFLQLVRALAAANENDPDVWAAIISPFELLSRVVEGQSADALRAFLRSIARPALDRVGWDPSSSEHERAATLRATLFAALGTTGRDPDVVALANGLHNRLLEDRAFVAPDLVPAVLEVVAGSGGEAEYHAFLERFRNPVSPQEQIRYLYRLASFEHPALVRRTLDLAESNEVRTQNAPFLVNELLANRAGGETAWAWLEEHWDDVTTRWPDNAHARMVANITKLIAPGLAERVRSFLEAHPVRAGHRTVEQYLEHLSVNVAFANRTSELTAALREA